MVKGLFIPAAAAAPVELREYRSLEDYQAAVAGWIEAVDIPSFGPVSGVPHSGVTARWSASS